MTPAPYPRAVNMSRGTQDVCHEPDDRQFDTQPGCAQSRLIRAASSIEVGHCPARTRSLVRRAQYDQATPRTGATDRRGSARPAHDVAVSSCQTARLDLASGRSCKHGGAGTEWPCETLAFITGWQRS